MKTTTQFVPLLVLLSVMAFLFTGCSYLSSDKDAYKKSRAVRSLEAPPELVLPKSDKGYQIPGQGVRVSEQSQQNDQADQTQDSDSQNNGQNQESSTSANSNGTNSKEAKAKSEGYFAGNGKQWIHINSSVNAIWDPLVLFWQERNDTFEKKDKALGVIQTNWINPASRETTDGKQSLLKAFGGLTSGHNRERYTITISETGEGTDIILRQEKQEKIIENEISHHSKTHWKDQPESTEEVAEVLKLLYKDLTSH